MIRPVQPRDSAAWVKLRCALWPEGAPDHAAEVARFFAGGATSGARSPSQNGVGSSGSADAGPASPSETDVAPTARSTCSRARRRMAPSLLMQPFSSGSS